jgi:hypothetical protein
MMTLRRVVPSRSFWLAECLCLTASALAKSVQYPQEELFNAIKEGLDHAYRQGKISEALYVASCGHESDRPGQPEEGSARLD